MDDHRNYSDPQHRLLMVSKMQEYERLGWFNNEIEDSYQFEPLDVKKNWIFSKNWIFTKKVEK